ncbi:MAG: hypothetical protein STSR0002_28990 [Smithella sp.]|jgi:hypothetical protein
MKNMIMIMIICVALLMTVKGWSIDKKLLEDPYPHQQPYIGPVTDDVRIVFSGAYMPIGRFLLIRKKDEVCALKFTRFWNEKQGKEQEKYAAYISYYQNDGSGNLLSQNVKIIEGKASNLPLRGWSRLFFWQPGISYVKCGPLKFVWNYYGAVVAFEKGDSPGDHGFEFAPTPWENITEVNVSDKRIKWYRYDKDRRDIDIPIDKLRDSGTP